jgi:hypothetical protein
MKVYVRHPTAKLSVLTQARDKSLRYRAANKDAYSKEMNVSRNRRLRVLAAVAALALLVGACGGGDDDGGEEGGDSVSPETYASDICTAVGDWVTAIQEGASEIATSADASSGVEVLQSFLEDAVTETEALISEVEDAGAPDVDGGEEFADQLQSAFDEAKTVLEDARDDAADLPTDDPAAFSTAAAELGTSVQEALGAVGSELSEPSDESLATAFEEEEACTSIGT